jgi:lysophospholipase L1-like esterase
MPSRRLTSRLVLASLLLAAWLLPLARGAEPQAEAEQKASRWESAIAAFEARDRQEAPPKNGIVFVGSSSIRQWKLEESFPGLPVVNRGFGGSQVADSVEFVHRIVLPHEPRIVVMYAGDNDLASGKSPETVAADFSAFASKVHAALPKARIVYIGIKPSLARRKLVDKVRVANRQIAAACREDERLTFVDVDKPTLGDDGMPRGELFVKDGLHLSPEGYRLWATLVAPHLKLD